LTCQPREERGGKYTGQSGTIRLGDLGVKKKKGKEEKGEKNALPSTIASLKGKKKRGGGGGRGRFGKVGNCCPQCEWGEKEKDMEWRRRFNKGKGKKRKGRRDFARTYY